jgi:hypothetical protein
MLVRRRRKCSKCGERFTTHEKLAGADRRSKDQAVRIGFVGAGLSIRSAGTSVAKLLWNAKKIKGGGVAPQPPSRQGQTAGGSNLALMSKKEREALSKRLWTVRMSRRWTQARAAAAVGISLVALSRAERGIFSGDRSQSIFLIRKFLENAE